MTTMTNRGKLRLVSSIKMGDVQGPTVNLPGGTFSHIKMHDLSNETHEI